MGNREPDRYFQTTVSLRGAKRRGNPYVGSCEPDQQCLHTERINAFPTNSFLSCSARRQKAPLCKGSCHGAAMTEGLFAGRDIYEGSSDPLSRPCGRQLPLVTKGSHVGRDEEVNCPKGKRDHSGVPGALYSGSCKSDQQCQHRERINAFPTNRLSSYSVGATPCGRPA